MFFSSTGACTATKCPIANHRSPIVAQLYFASVTQMFLMPLFVKVESDSSKLWRTVSKSGPNGCKERWRPQKMLMRIKIENLLGRQNLFLTVTHFHKQPREEQKVIVTWTALTIITNFFKIFRHGYNRFWSSTAGWNKRMRWKEIIDMQRSLGSWSRLGHYIIRSISPAKHVFCDGLCQHRRRFLERTKDLCRRSRCSSFYINEPITGFLWQLRCKGK